MNRDVVNKLYDKNKGYYSSTRGELLKYCPPQCTRVLDVGCGEGWFGKSVKDFCGAEVWGMDISAASIKLAEQNLDKAFCGDIAAADKLLPDGYFDAIFFNDVLEHLVDPYTLLETIAMKLSKNGVVIASIPNIRHHKVLYDLLVKKDFRYVDAGVMDNTHLRFFTKKSIQRMFKAAGYQILELAPINKSKSIKPILYKIVTLGLIGNDISYLQYVIRARKDGVF